MKTTDFSENIDITGGIIVLNLKSSKSTLQPETNALTQWNKRKKGATSSLFVTCFFLPFQLLASTQSAASNYESMFIVNTLDIFFLVVVNNLKHKPCSSAHSNRLNANYWVSELFWIRLKMFHQSPEMNFDVYKSRRLLFNRNANVIPQ